MTQLSIPIQTTLRTNPQDQHITWVGVYTIWHTNQKPSSPNHLFSCINCPHMQVISDTQYHTNSDNRYFGHILFRTLVNAYLTSSGNNYTESMNANQHTKNIGQHRCWSFAFVVLEKLLWAINASDKWVLFKRFKDENQNALSTNLITTAYTLLAVSLHLWMLCKGSGQTVLSSTLIT